MSSPDLVLDPQLKYWVLLPISFVMVLVGLLKSNINVLLTPSPSLTPYKKVREKQFLRRAECFRANNGILNKAEFGQRQQYFIEKLNSSEFYAEEIDPDAAPPNPFADQGTNDALMNMVKSNLMNYIPQTVIMAWVNYFFAAFIVMKLPFPLTDGFKSMLQTGVATPDLNVRYVSAISWYFVNLLGLKPIYSILGDSNAAAEVYAQQLHSMPDIGTAGTPKVDKVYKSCAENLQILSHNEGIFDGIAQRVLKSCQ